MVDAEEPIAYELRARLDDGSRMIVGPFATHAAAAERAHLLLGVQAVRIETLRRVGGRVELLGIIGRPKPPQRGDHDPLQPRQVEDGIVW